MTGFLRRILCALGMHRSYDVIQTFGAAQHIGCPDCGREFGIHHGERVVIPWDPELDEMYALMGHETAPATKRWHDYLRSTRSPS